MANTFLCDMHDAAETGCLILRKHFLLLLLGAYVLAATAPGFGLWLRQISLWRFDFSDGSHVKITLSLVMLSYLLFNAGLGITLDELKGLWKRPLVITAGFLANIIVPIILVVYLCGFLQFWHDSDELQNLLVGLALIIAMPIAGASTAWAQNASGNVSLSLGLIFLSTILSPLTTPIVLHILGWLTAGDYSSDLHEMANQGKNSFMLTTVVVPSLAGMLVSLIPGKARVASLKPFLKLLNFAVLLLLNYSNAATTLPQAAQHPDLDYLSLIFAVALVVCATAFGAGWLLSKLLKTNRADRASLVFGLGMSNSGTGLVLATATLADHPLVLLPMIFYTLIQQVVAAVVDKAAQKTASQT